MTTSVSADFSIRSGAGPLNKPCVAKAKILAAPIILSSFAAVHSVPAVSIMSSTMMQSQSCHPDARVSQASLRKSGKLWVWGAP